MALTTLTAIPSTIEQGNDYSISLAYAELPTATWTSAVLVLARPGSGVQPIQFNATVSSSRYNFSLTHLVTASIAPAIWQYSVYVFDADSNRVCAESGTIGVLDNLMVVQEQTPAARMLAALEAAIEKLSGSSFSTVSFNGQSYTRSSIGMLQDKRVQLQAEVLREQYAQRRLRGTAPSGFSAVQFA